MPTVRTRFAPSPTGYMHIGGMRTALFNWLWARHTGGVFVLRIDDTDRQRNLDEALAPILNAFRWLGLGWDEGPEVGGKYAPYFQSERTHLYQEAAEKLLRDGKAYRCFDTPAQIQIDRELAEKEKRPYVNIRRSLELSPAQVKQYESEGRPATIRFLVPREQKVQLSDVVRGEVEWDASLIADPVIMRADGTPLYNFATVIDDSQMDITHVIRAEEHLSNTPVQILIHQALGNTLPTFAHIPYVAAPGTKEKLSKRDNKLEKYRKNPQFKKMFEAADAVFPRIGLGGSATLNPVMVEYYEKIGYLPEAVLNALSRLGWSLDDKTEILSLATIVENFTLDRVVKNPAGLDPDKLNSFQAHWMNQLPLEQKVDGCLPYLNKAGLISGAAGGDSPDDAATRDYVTKAVAAVGDRLTLFSDILSFDDLFVPDDKLAYDEKAFEKSIKKPGAKEILQKYRARLDATSNYNPEALEKSMKEFVEAEGLKIGDVIHPVRVAITGKSTGPGMFECLAILGKSRCLNRIDRACLWHSRQPRETHLVNAPAANENHKCRN